MSERTVMKLTAFIWFVALWFLAMAAVNRLNRIVELLEAGR